MERLIYLIGCMTNAMDKNMFSESSAHLRLLVYYASQILADYNSADDIESYISKFNNEIKLAEKRGIWTPYKSW